MLGRDQIYSAAYGCLLEQKWRTLPVEPDRFQSPCAILSYQAYADLAGIPADRLPEELTACDGYSVAGLREKPLLLYNGSLPPGRRRFTVAHELGHLLLGHRERGKRQEEEADLFASALLMPDALLYALLRRGLLLTDAFLTETFGVSRAAARKKRQALVTPPLPHPLDASVEALFYHEIRRLAPLPETDAAALDRYLDQE